LPVKPWVMSFVFASTRMDMRGFRPLAVQFDRNGFSQRTEP
jgi:hypothetical protein